MLTKNTNMWELKYKIFETRIWKIELGSSVLKHSKIFTAFETAKILIPHY